MLRDGGTLNDAASILGTKPRTLRLAYRRGRSIHYGEKSGHAAYAELYVALHSAMTSSRKRLLNLVANKALKDWRAGAWLLDRLDREEEKLESNNGPTEDTGKLMRATLWDMANKSAVSSPN